MDSISSAIKGACIAFILIALFGLFGWFWALAIMLYTAAGFNTWLLFRILAKHDAKLKSQGATLESSMVMSIVMWPVLSVFVVFSYSDGRVRRLLRGWNPRRHHLRQPRPRHPLQAQGAEMTYEEAIEKMTEAPEMINPTPQMIEAGAAVIAIRGLDGFSNSDDRNLAEDVLRAAFSLPRPVRRYNSTKPAP